jgi:CBS domain-containing protein
MKVRDIMNKNARFCRLRDTLAHVVNAMWEGDCGLLPIVDKADRVAGVITDRDVALAAWRKDRAPADIRVDELPFATLHACAPTDEVDDAIRIMQQARVRRLPVIDENERLVGIISMNDLAFHAREATERKDGLTADKVVNTLKAICSPRKLKHATKRPALAPHAR